jgi:hypothetical protein
MSSDGDGESETKKPPADPRLQSFRWESREEILPLAPKQSLEGVIVATV